jgi:hypothetical protein
MAVQRAYKSILETLDDPDLFGGLFDAPVRRQMI